jgi:hypothetical protein
MREGALPALFDYFAATASYKRIQATRGLHASGVATRAAAARMATQA